MKFATLAYRTLPDQNVVETQDHTLVHNMLPTKLLVRQIATVKLVMTTRVSLLGALVSFAVYLGALGLCFVQPLLRQSCYIHTCKLHTQTHISYNQRMQHTKHTKHTHTH